MHDNSEHIDRLITRYLFGEATPEECAQLEEWLEKSEANKKYFARIRFISNKAKASKQKIQVDVDSAWEQVRKKMDSSGRDISLNSSRRPGPLNAKVMPARLPGWLKAAAILVLISTISWFLYDQLHTRYEEPGILAFTSNDSIVSKSMDDNTEITLNRNSTVKYTSDYGKTERRVILEGEAFFEVQSVPDLPFVVQARETIIKQLATSFNIKAYENNTLVEVFTKSGKLRFFTRDKEGIVLKEGEKGVYNRNTKEFSKTVPEITNVTAYVDRKFEFQNTPLKEVFQNLSYVYRVNIHMEDEEIEDLSISVYFENEELRMILDIICETLDLQWHETDNGDIVVEKNSESLV